MKLSIKKNISIALIIVATSVIGSTTLPVKASVNSDISKSHHNEKYNINFSKEMSKLNSVPFQKIDSNTKVRSIKLNNDLTLNEELTSQNPVSSLVQSATALRQVTSKVTLKNNIGLTAATLTAIGYYNHNGSTCYAYDADSSSSTGLLYSCSDYVSYIGTTPIGGYARVTCKYHVVGSLDLVWGNVTVSEVNGTANVFCNQNGDYYSQWN